MRKAILAASVAIISSNAIAVDADTHLQTIEEIAGHSSSNPNPVQIETAIVNLKNKQELTDKAIRKINAVGNAGNAGVSDLKKEYQKDKIERLTEAGKMKGKMSSNSERITNAEKEIYGATALYNASSKDINENTANIEKNTHAIAQTQADLNAFKKKTNAAFAGLAAMNNIPLVVGYEYSVGAGIGYYDSESAISFGGNYQLEENIAIKASFAGNPNNWQPIIGAGVAYGF